VMVMRRTDPVEQAEQIETSAPTPRNDPADSVHRQHSPRSAMERHVKQVSQPLNSPGCLDAPTA
jgi:hypothetical protein